MKILFQTPTQTGSPVDQYRAVLAAATFGQANDLLTDITFAAIAAPTPDPWESAVATLLDDGTVSRTRASTSCRNSSICRRPKARRMPSWFIYGRR